MNMLMFAYDFVFKTMGGIKYYSEFESMFEISCMRYIRDL